MAMLDEIKRGTKLFIAYLVASVMFAVLATYTMPFRLYGFFVGAYIGIVIVSLMFFMKRKFGPFRWFVATFILWSVPAVLGVVFQIDTLIQAYYYLSSPFVFSSGILFAMILGFFTDTGEELTFATFIAALFAILSMLYCPTLEGLTVLELAKNYIVKVSMLWFSVLAGTLIAKYIKRIR